MTALTSSDVVQGGQHPQHERGGDCDGVSSLLQHELVPSYDLGGKLTDHVRDKEVTVLPHEDEDSSEEISRSPEGLLHSSRGRYGDFHPEAPYLMPGN